MTLPKHSADKGGVMRTVRIFLQNIVVLSRQEADEAGLLTEEAACLPPGVGVCRRMWKSQAYPAPLMHRRWPHSYPGQWPRPGPHWLCAHPRFELWKRNAPTSKWVRLRTHPLPPLAGFDCTMVRDTLQLAALLVDGQPINRRAPDPPSRWCSRPWARRFLYAPPTCASG